MDHKKIAWEKFFFAAIEIAFAINIIVLDIWIIGQIKKIPVPNAASIFLPPTPVVSPVPTTEVLNPLVPSATPTPTVIPTPVVVYQQTSAPTVKEYYVPLGSSSGNSTDWSDAAGLQSYVDTGNYPNIKQVTFEISSQIPTGNQTAEVRLFNKTAGHPVWFSDVSFSGGQTVFLTSQPITLDTGNNLYQVQIKTQLGYNVVLNQARIHITLR